jgi:hypothetical protein
MRRVFWIINNIFMVPMFRLGLDPFIGNVVTGYIMVLKTVGRKTGKTRFTPVNYAIQVGIIDSQSNLFRTRKPCESSIAGRATC